MFLLDFYYDNTCLNGSGYLGFREARGKIRKWTVLCGGSATVELLRLIAVSCLGKNFLVPAASRFHHCLAQTVTRNTRLEFVTMQHSPRDCPATAPPVLAAGIEISEQGVLTSLAAKQRQRCRQETPWRLPATGTGIHKYFALGYGPCWRIHADTDSFDFSRPYQRLDRFASLFDETSLLTDTPVFLQRLHYRFLKNRRPAVQTLELLVRELNAFFGIDTSSWLLRNADFKRLIAALSPDHQYLLRPVIDSVRHIMDASPHDLDPLARQGIILAAHPLESSYTDSLPAWLELMDRIFPNIQFIIALSEEKVSLFPEQLRSGRLTIQEKTIRPRKNKKMVLGRLGKDIVLLVDVDGRIPNLALMKLSRWFRNQGCGVRLVRHDNWQVDQADVVYASCVFTFPVSQRRVRMLRRKFGDALHLGGSGVDLKLRLPEEIEAGLADFDLYPAMEGKAMGFLTRGCTRQCPFCLVPVKEGLPRRVADLDELLQGRRKLVLLDDNILAFSEAEALLEEMAARKIQVNFNQTLDIRLVDAYRASLLRRIRCSNYAFTRNIYHFSLNDLNDLDIVRRNYELFGFRPRRDNVEFVCMYGFNTTLAEDVRRFRFLRSLPGAYVFVQEYRPVLNGAQADLDNFFGPDPDRLIDQLIRIVFPQNMKSMEKYYRWLSRRYFETFGCLHQGLVDTIFKYNHRARKGLYIAAMLSGRGSGYRQRQG